MGWKGKVRTAERPRVRSGRDALAEGTAVFSLFVCFIFKPPEPFLEQHFLEQKASRGGEKGWRERETQMGLEKYDLPSHESQNYCLKLNPPGVLHRHGGKGEGREGKKDLLLKQN